MANLFGREYTREELLEKVGGVEQIGGVRRLTLAEGNETGVEEVEFRTGSGLRFTALASRGLDIAAAEYRGVPLCWRSPCGDVHPAYYEPEGLGWLRSFYGGLMISCGLTWFGAPHEDPDGGVEAHSGLGLHGRISHIPAKNLYVDGAWEGDDYVMWAQGKMRETMVFGPNLLLERKISARLGGNCLWVDDVVTNEGFDECEHMFLYHCNLGFPVVDEGGEYLFPSVEAIPRTEIAADYVNEWRNFPGPTAGQEELVYYHRLNSESDGTTYVAFVNRQFGEGQGIGVYLKFNVNQLPWLAQWKMPGVGTYVTGIEPGTGRGDGRPAERESGRMITLAPGEQRNYHLEIGVLTNQEEIAQIESLITGLS